MKLRYFFDTEWGRKLLFFLAPFFLSPQDVQPHSQKETDHTLRHHALHSLLSYSFYAPLLGSAVLTSSLISLLRVLAGKGIPLEWIFHFKSGSLIFTIAGLMAWLAYSAGGARVAAGWFLRTFGTLNGGENFNWPLPFWLSYYGGILMVWGLFLWGVVGLLSLPMSWIYSLSGLLLMIFFGVFLRLELKVAQQRHRRVVHYIDWHRFTRTSFFLFLIMQGLIVFCIVLLKG